MRLWLRNGIAHANPRECAAIGRVVGRVRSCCRAADAATPPLGAAVDCTSSPERVVITNYRAKPVTIRRVGSMYQRRAGEPFRLRKVLKLGKHVVYSFGSGKGGKRLSGSYVFDNESSREGVVVKSDKDRVKVLCGDATNASLAPATALPDQDSFEPSSVQNADALALLTGLTVDPSSRAGMIAHSSSTGSTPMAMAATHASRS